MASNLIDYIDSLFPDGPVEGSEFIWGGVRYVFDSSPGIWTGAIPDPAEVQNVATGGESPTNPLEGDLWYDGQRLMVRDNDAWIDASPSPTPEELANTPFLTTFKDGDEVSGVAENTRIMDFVGDGVEVTGDGSTGTAIVTIGSTGLPNLPESTSDATNYILNVPQTGGADPTWQEAATGVSLQELTDTNVPNAGSITMDHVLTWSGSAWVPRPTAPGSLGALTDTSIPSSITSDHVLTWTGSAWAPAAPAAGTLSGLLDTAISSPTDGQVLKYNGTSWVSADDDDTVVSVSPTRNSITVDGTRTELTTPETLTLASDGTTLTLGRNNATDLTVDLAALSGEDNAATIIVQEDGTTEVSAATINFTGDLVDVDTTGTTATINIDSSNEPATIRITEDSAERTNAARTLNFDGDDFNITTNTDGSIASIAIDTDNIPPGLTGVTVQNSGSQISSTATTLNFGDRITATGSGSTITISADEQAGTGGGGNPLQVQSGGIVLGTDVTNIIMRDSSNFDYFSSHTSNNNQTVEFRFNDLPDIPSQTSLTIQDSGTDVVSGLDDNILNFAGSLEVTNENGVATITQPNLTLAKDNTTVLSNPGVIDFTGNVNVTNRGGGRVEVNVPDSGGSSGGGGTPDLSPILVQTSFNKSSTKFTKDQWHFSGGTYGSKYRLMFKNNHATNYYNVRYRFNLATSKTPNDNIASGIIYNGAEASSGLWDSDNEEFLIYTPGHNGGAAWRPDSFRRIAPRESVLMEIDLHADGRVSFYSDNDTYILWNFATLNKVM